MSPRSIALCRYYNLMRMGEKNYAASNNSRDEGDLECMVAIKEIKMPEYQKQKAKNPQ